MAACLHLWLEEAQIQTIRFRADSPVRVYTSCSKNVFWQHAAYATTRHKDGTFLEWSFSLSFATDITLKVFFCFRKKKKWNADAKTDFTRPLFVHKQQLSDLMRRGSAFYRTWLQNKDLRPTFWPHTTRGHHPLPYTGMYRIERRWVSYEVPLLTWNVVHSEMVFLHGCSKIGLKIPLIQIFSPISTSAVFSIHKC